MSDRQTLRPSAPWHAKARAESERAENLSQIVLWT